MGRGGGEDGESTSGSAGGGSEGGGGGGRSVIEGVKPSLHMNYQSHSCIDFRGTSACGVTEIACPDVESLDLRLHLFPPAAEFLLSLLLATPDRMSASPLLIRITLLKVSGLILRLSSILVENWTAPESATYA